MNLTGLNPGRGPQTQVSSLVRHRDCQQLGFLDLIFDARCVPACSIERGIVLQDVCFRWSTIRRPLREPTRVGDPEHTCNRQRPTGCTDNTSGDLTLSGRRPQRIESQDTRPADALALGEA